MIISHIKPAQNILYEKRFCTPNFTGTKTRHECTDERLAGLDEITTRLPISVLLKHSERQKELYGETRINTDPFYEAFHDALSGLRNKEYLLCRLPRIAEKAVENGNGIAVAMFDMDNFKSINEFLGYKTGDKFIQRIGKHIRDVACDNDLGSYRYGGEEFVIVFKNNDKKKAKEIASKIQSAIVNDPELGIYMDEYIETGSEKLKKAKIENEMISDLRIKYRKAGFWKEACAEYRSDTGDCKSDFTDYLDTKRILSNIDLIRAYARIIKKAYKDEGNPALIKKLAVNANNIERIEILTDLYFELSEAIKANGNDKNNPMYQGLEKQLKSCASMINIMADDFSANKPMYDYLCQKYDHSAVINQYAAWLNHIKSSGEFTITCGIKDYGADELEECINTCGAVDAEKLVDEAGEILKAGKNIRKGQVYTKSVLLMDNN